MRHQEETRRRILHVDTRASLNQAADLRTTPGIIEVCRRSARAAARFARAASEVGPTVTRLATARAADWGAAKLRSKRKSGPSGQIRTAGRTGAFFSD